MLIYKNYSPRTFFLIFFSTSELVYLSNSNLSMGGGGCPCEARSEEWSHNSYELQDLLANQYSAARRLGSFTQLKFRTRIIYLHLLECKIWNKSGYLFVDMICIRRSLLYCKYLWVEKKKSGNQCQLQISKNAVTILLARDRDTHFRERNPSA